MKKEKLPKVEQRIRYKVGREGSTKVAIVTNIYPDEAFPIEISRRGVKGRDFIKLDEVIHNVKKGEKDAKA